MELIQNILYIPVYIASFIMCIGLDLSIANTILSIATLTNHRDDAEEFFQLNSKAFKYSTRFVMSLVGIACISYYFLHWQATPTQTFIITLVLAIVDSWYLFVLGKYHYNRIKYSNTKENTK